MSKLSEREPLAGVRVLIVEDEALIAEELRLRLSRLGMHVVAAVSSGDAAIQHALRDRPDAILIDVRLKGSRDGIDTVREIRRHSDVAIVYLTAHSDRSTIERAKDTSPDGYVLKPFQERDLLVALEMALHRHNAAAARPADPPGEDAAELSAIRERFERLTPRQREVFKLVVRGRLNRQIAAELGTTERTIKAHRALIMKKMEVESVADLARLAQRLGM
jgi:DNA-binding NarL/FixJ family response regulator